MMCCIKLGGCMDEKKKELKTNLISSFLILLSCCLTVALLINLRFHQDCATVIVGMLGVCATLYAPVAAFFFYDSWKIQAHYHLKQNLLLELWNSITEAKLKFTYCVNNPPKKNYDPDTARILGLKNLNIDEIEEERRYSQKREELQTWLERSSLNILKYSALIGNNDIKEHYHELSNFSRDLSKIVYSKEYKRFLEIVDKITDLKSPTPLRKQGEFG